MKINKFCAFWVASLVMVLSLYSCNGGATNQDPFLNLEPSGNLLFPSEGATTTIQVKTNLKVWSYTVSDQDWCVVERDQSGEDQITVTALENTSYNIRQAIEIKITATDDVEVLNSIIRVSQEGAEKIVTDLSASATANSYVVTAPGFYSFNATVRGNGYSEEGEDPIEAINPTGATLVWQSEKDLVSEISLINGVLRFTVSDLKGNAVVAATDGEGEILWSWHIWVPEESILELATANSQIMNLNLGALNSTPGDVKSYGLLYQWGRKDPFPNTGDLVGTVATKNADVYDIEGEVVSITNSSHSDKTNNTIEYAIQNPTICMSSMAEKETTSDWLKSELTDHGLWGNPVGHSKDPEGQYTVKGNKSIYDPCPPGWRVPDAGIFKDFTTSGGYAWVIEDFNIFDINEDGIKDLGDYNYGWNMVLSEGVNSYFPAAARYDGSYAMLMGSVAGIWGSYWANCPYVSETSTPGLAMSIFSFSTKNIDGSDMLTMSPDAGAGRADALSVRCMKE